MANFLFRGTSENYEGNISAQTIPTTCTSKCPFLAYLFAKESSKYGSGIILIFDEKEIEDIERNEANVFSDDEKEVSLKIKPINVFGREIIAVSIQIFEKTAEEMNINIETYATKLTNNRYKSKKQLTKKEMSEFVKLLILNAKKDV